MLMDDIRFLDLQYSVYFAGDMAIQMESYFIWVKGFVQDFGAFSNTQIKLPL